MHAKRFNTFLKRWVQSTFTSKILIILEKFYLEVPLFLNMVKERGLLEKENACPISRQK